MVPGGLRREGAGISHDFPRFVLEQDTEPLQAAGGFDSAATPNLDERLTLLPQADVKPDYPILRGVPAQFTITDESYHSELDAGTPVEVLAENAPDQGTTRSFPQRLDRHRPQMPHRLHLPQPRRTQAQQRGFQNTPVECGEMEC
jgi:hypothetical protein